MSKHNIDFARVEDHQLPIHERLCNWGSWVTPRPGSAVSPMFRQYRSHAWQWHAPSYRDTCDILDAKRIEQTMRHLPAPHRDALIWAYIVRCAPWIACRHIGTTPAGLFTFLRDGRQMVANLAK